MKSFEHKRKQNSGFVKDKYIKDIPTLNLRDIKAKSGDNRYNFIQQMVSCVKFTIPKVDNSQRVRASFKVPRDTFCKNAPLDLD